MVAFYLIFNWNSWNELKLNAAMQFGNKENLNEKVTQTETITFLTNSQFALSSIECVYCIIQVVMKWYIVVRH